MISAAAVESASEPTAESAARPSPAQLDRLLGILQNRRRRLVLEFLRVHDSTTQSDLARHIAAVENDVSEAAVTSTQRKRVYVSLYQAHLPKLDDFGAVSFDRDRGTVERTPRTDELLLYLDRIEAASETETASDGPFVLGTVAVACLTLAVGGSGVVGMLPARFSLGAVVLLSVGGLMAILYALRGRVA